MNQTTAKYQAYVIRFFPSANSCLNFLRLNQFCDPPMQFRKRKLQFQAAVKGRSTRMELLGSSVEMLHP